MHRASPQTSEVSISFHSCIIISFSCAALSVVQRWAMGWMIWDSSHGRGWEFFSSPTRPDRLGGPSSLLSNGYEGLFPLG
jgi:hypothetical protein